MRDECERAFDGDARPRPTAQDINDSYDSDVTYQYIGLQWSNQVPMALTTSPANITPLVI